MPTQLPKSITSPTNHYRSASNHESFLMYKDHDFDVQQELPVEWTGTDPGPGMDTLFNPWHSAITSAGCAKKLSLPVWKIGRTRSLYRKHLKDCLNIPLCQDLYQNRGRPQWKPNRRPLGLAAENSNPAYVMSVSEARCQMFVGNMKQWELWPMRHADKFESDGF